MADTPATPSPTLPEAAVPPAAPSVWRRCWRAVWQARWWQTPAAAHAAFGRMVRLLGWLVGLGVVVWAGHQLVHYRWKHIQEVDTQGYFEIAKAFAHGSRPLWPDELGRFTGHVWVDPHGHVPPGPAGARGTQPAAPPPPLNDAAPPLVTSKYPPGWPLCLAAGYLVHGAHGALWVNPVLAVVGVLVFFLLATELAGPIAGGICTFIWVTSPMFVMYVDYPLGHGPEVTFTLTAFYCTLRWARTGRARWALPAGFCGAFIPLIRPTTVLYWPVLVLFYLVIRHEEAADRPKGSERTWRELVCLPLNWGRGLRLREWRPWLRSPGVRPWLAVAGGAAVPLLFQASYSLAVYGSLVHTGYYFTREQQAFDLNWLWSGANAWFGSTWQGGLTTQWVQWRWQQVWAERAFLLEDQFLVLGALALCFRWRHPGRVVVGALLLVPSLVLYVSYYYFWGGPVFYRFFYSAVPALVLSVTCLFGGWVARAPVVQLAALVGFSLWTWHEPPRYFLRQAQVARGENLDPRRFPYGSPQARDALTNGFAQEQLVMKTADLEPWLTTGPTVVYAGWNQLWEVAIYPDLIACDLNAWVSGSLIGSGRERGGPGAVWPDRQRAERIRAQVLALGVQNLPDVFRAQVGRHLAAGRRVFLLTPFDHPLLQWVNEMPGVTATKVYERQMTPELDRAGLTPAQLWEIRRPPAKVAQTFLSVPLAPHRQEGLCHFPVGLTTYDTSNQPKGVWP